MSGVRIRPPRGDLFKAIREEILPQAQKEIAGVRVDQDELPKGKTLLREARARAARERDLSSSTQTAYYPAASLGQSPYVSLPGVGTVVLRKGGWSC